MKKIKAWINGVWFRVVIQPYLLRHKPECAMALKDAIVYQMWYAGIGFTNINKWLSAMNCDTIKGYLSVPQAKGRPNVKIYYGMPKGGYPARMVRVA